MLQDVKFVVNQSTPITLGLVPSDTEVGTSLVVDGKALISAGVEFGMRPLVLHIQEMRSRFPPQVHFDIVTQEREVDGLSVSLFRLRTIIELSAMMWNCRLYEYPDVSDTEWWHIAANKLDFAGNTMPPLGTVASLALALKHDAKRQVSENVVDGQIDLVKLSKDKRTIQLVGEAPDTSVPRPGPKLTLLGKNERIDKRGH